MTGQQDGDALFCVQPLEQGAQLHDTAGIQAVDGFVQNQQRRLPQQGDGKAQPLLLAQGEALAFFPALFQDAHKLHNLLHLFPARNTLLDAVIFQGVLHGHVGEKAGMFDDDAHLPAAAAEFLFPGLAEQADLPCGGKNMPCQEL